MSVKIGVLKELSLGERRVAATPETVKKFMALGSSVTIEHGAGAYASVGDDAYAQAGATLSDRAAVIKDADIILSVQGPDPVSLAGVKPGAWLVGNLDPFAGRERIDGCGHVGAANRDQVDLMLTETIPKSSHKPIHMVVEPSSRANADIAAIVSTGPGSVRRRVPYRSTNIPKKGPSKAIAKVAIDGPEDKNVRLQPNSSASGCINRPVLEISTEKREKPSDEANTTFQPAFHSLGVPS